MTGMTEGLVHPLLNLSPLDGRYAEKVDELRTFFSEAALIRYRVIVELEWFIFLCNDLKLKGTKVWSARQLEDLRGMYQNFEGMDATHVKGIEATTNHDVKAVEYFLREKFKGTVFEPYNAFLHFACTSEDMNNMSYGLMLQGAREAVLEPLMTGVVQRLYEMAKQYKSLAMVGRTHGQLATPTTLGKELVNVVARLERQLAQAALVEFMGKMNGAVGNFNAHVAAYPSVDWADASKKFVHNLGLSAAEWTTQIEPHDYMAEFFDALCRFNTVLMDFNRDMWGYISLGYFTQKVKKGEVGSSTMPHKVNPIDFENSEGNLGLANALLRHMGEKLPISRWQRDLTDSTVQRNIGSALGYCMLAYKNCLQGLGKVEVNKMKIAADIDDAWELMAEPIQTVMRAAKMEDAYEQLKALSRGKTLTKKMVHEFVDKLKIPAPDKKRLKSLTPATYIGVASKLVDAYKPQFFKG